MNARLATFAWYVWESDAFSARLTRALLSPLEALFGAVVRRRNAAFDRQQSTASSRATLPAISVGNLTVGGTGKTPIASWLASQLRAGGARPALILRGYGDDEWLVHTLLTPNVPVVVSADRSAGLATARTRGADCAVLDDAFQHRQVRRAADVVLVSVDRWREDVRLLPAGPFREPLSALRRAAVVILTSKAASAERARAVELVIEQAAPGIPVVHVRLHPGHVRLAVSLPAVGHAGVAGNAGDAAASGKVLAAPLGPSGLTHDVAWLAGKRFVSVSAIGDPRAFEEQLRRVGAKLEPPIRFPDHHRYTVADAKRIARAASGSDGVICTLKDAVKLKSLWPRAAPPLWYVSQTVVIERGAEALNRVLTRLLSARITPAPTAG